MFIRHRQGMRGSGTIAGFCALGRLKELTTEGTGLHRGSQNPRPSERFRYWWKPSNT